MVILLQTPSPIRHAFYETFLHVHQALVAVVVWAIYNHMKGYSKQTKIVQAIIAIWATEVSENSKMTFISLINFSAPYVCFAFYTGMLEREGQPLRFNVSPVVLCVLKFDLQDHGFSLLDNTLISICLL